MKATFTPCPVVCWAFFLLLSTSGFAQKWDTLAPIPESFTFPVVAVADGRIHIMGGGGVGGATNHHFAYDPATDTWESRAAVPYLAQQPAGAAANGKIHFFGGGYPNSGSPVDDHHIYDPATNSWDQAADLTAPRAIHYAVTLDDVLYSLAGQNMTNLCQTYDPVEDAWTTKNTLPDNFFFYGAHVATEGHIYRFGGGGYAAPKDFAHRYTPGMDTWAALPSLPNANHGLRGTAIGNKIYLAGGYHDFLERDEVYVFDTETEEYTPSVPLPLGRNYHNMVSIDSCIYVVGGNHAIDQTVTFQLLRFCPFESPSPTVEASPMGTMTTRFAAGNLLLTLPDGLSASQVSVFNMAGQQVFRQQVLAFGEHIEVPVGQLPPSVYLVRVKTGESILSAKFIAH